MDFSTDSDFMFLNSDPDIKKIIGEERINFSYKIQKINRFLFSQERILIITNLHIYNFKDKILKRKINLKYLKGITESNLSNEIVIHFRDEEYDYHYESPRKKKIIECILYCYYRKNTSELVFSQINEKSLKKFVTTKKDKKKDKNCSKIPKNAKIIEDYGHFFDHNENSSIIEYKNELEIKGKNPGFLKESVRLNEFNFIKEIGRGTFGKVLLGEFKKTGEYFAIKSIKKDQLIDQKQIQNTLNEKMILEKLKSDFILQLLFTFQTPEKIYFVLPFVEGGELFKYLRSERIFSEEKTLFFASQILLGLEHLHANNVLYRDLKPENVLIGLDGYIKLADFGVSRILKPKEEAHTFCGTPEYVAPEVLAKEKYNHTCDYWSFGVILYEMLCGTAPFYHQNLKKMFEMIMKNELKFSLKVPISEEAKDLISKLLVKNPQKRLGSKFGVSEIKTHPFFHKIDFTTIENKLISPPFTPNKIGKFESSPTAKVRFSILPETKIELIKKNQSLFIDFD